MTDGDTYWQCEECGETTNGPHRSKPCKCAREWKRDRQDEREANRTLHDGLSRDEREHLRDRIVSVESGHTVHNFIRAKGREND